LSLALVAFAFTGHRQVESALMALAEARLRSSSGELEGLMARSVELELDTITARARRPEFAAYLRDPDPEGMTTVWGILDSIAQGGSGGRAAALLGLDGTRVIFGDSALALLQDGGSTSTAGLGPLAPWDGHVAFRVSAAVVEDADTLGYLVDARPYSGAEETRRQISDLIGNQAHLALGGSGVWTDLATRIEGPGADLVTGVVFTWEGSDGQTTFGIVTPIRGSPWMLWLGLPRSSILAPQRAFLGQTVSVALLLLVFGGSGAWLLSYRVVGRLGRLTSTSEAIAGGDYSRRFHSQKEDEVGRLGRAFDRMAERVQESRELLEDRVRERTEELEGALAELRSAQEELVRKERLALLGELAGGVGHELRNPLGVMTNAVFYLQAVMKDRPQDVDEYLEILRHQIHLSEKIVGDLLDFARVKPPKRAPTDMAALVDEQVDRCGELGGVTVERDFPQELALARVDAGQVGQIFLNLVTNAVQAMDGTEGGTLTLRGRAEGGWVVVDVQDTGPGIPPEIGDRIFEPLFTTKARGIGLGLSVTRSLVEANGGALDVGDAPGGGAMFTVRLPVEPEAG
jgi:signal transduction histidine kinase